ncbi:MAG: hypothetical protein JWN03_7023 [Nocardia sp.]|uniref:SDR family NAD(P)-dependent oxidoreductase n=1 Tax=Nocardia sp. TaxID=1821 RepID=UPI00260CE3C5|nr:SDR family NAD(P)-dependent oxidoreductase [Nocardia sp.]MCU1646748.1 hypothetical protein [Nocardia sp.]
MSSGEAIFTAADLERFAAATGDRNPLHLDLRFAQQTHYGELVVHGVLGVLAAFGQLGPAVSRVVELQVGFHHPMTLGSRVRITSDLAAETLRLRSAGLTVCTVRYRLAEEPLTAGEPGDGTPPGAVTRAEPEAEARVMDIDALAALGAEVGTHRSDTAAVREILGNAALPEHLVATLAWAGFWTGMRTPGRNAVLCGLRVTFSSLVAAGPEIQYRTQPPDVCPRTGFVRVNAVVAGRVHATVAIESFLRQPAPQATAASIAAHLRPGKRLAGRTTLVVGGSRGLGRALSLGLMSQGARVLAVSRAAAAHVAQMRDELGDGAERLHGIEADATDAVALRIALPPDLTRLDGLVLCSTPRLASLPLHIDASEIAAKYVNDCVRHCWDPLAACRDLLVKDAFVVIVSSRAVADPPMLWPHYVAAKGALEGFATYLARNFPWRVVVTRPPRMWTDLTSAPLSHVSAIATEAVAAEVVMALLEDGDGAVFEPVYLG